MANNYVFNTVPTIKHSRSRFDLSHSHKTAINAGDLIPFLVQEIYPGDSFDIDSKAVVRATSAFLNLLWTIVFWICSTFLSLTVLSILGGKL